MIRHMPHEDHGPAHGWDLHCHTVYSDGTKTPAEMIASAVASGLHGLAITDHDTTAGWADAAAAARRAGLPILRGTEITAADGDISVHMLAYQYDPDNTAITELFRATRAARLERAKRMVARLSEDFPIDWHSVLRQAKQGEKTTVGRPHMADALVEAGVYATRSEAFAGVISGASKYYIPTPSPSTDEVVRTVREAGGVSVIAHPGDRGRNTTLLGDGRIRALAGEGLGGLEVWHRGNADDQRRRLLGLADELGLLVTGGSDWHGAGKPNRLGENLTGDATVREIVARGAIEVVG